jgi:hypothetical protein
MQPQAQVREAADTLLALRPETETIESFLEKVVVEVVSRNHSLSERSAALRRALMRGIVARQELERAEPAYCTRRWLAMK